MNTHEGIQPRDIKTHEVISEAVITADTVLQYGQKLTDAVTDETGNRSLDVMPGVTVGATNRLTMLTVESLDGSERIRASVLQDLGGQTISFQSASISNDQKADPGMSARTTLTNGSFGKEGRFTSRNGIAINTALPAQDDLESLNERFTRHLNDRESGKVLDRKVILLSSAFRRYFPG